MPKPFPEEFRRDVIAVARTGEASIAQVAKVRDLGVLPAALVEDRRPRGRSRAACLDRSGRGSKDDAAELRELRRRNRLLEQENEILRRATAYFARDVLSR
ncbi:MAG: hypothetical protein JWO98_1951 [Frankiales bacterium]|nr:hypothetical protein [Frankiales bacterium]